jgi:LmbE family N-acetylglucosaminyl deacetylase
LNILVLSPHRDDAAFSLTLSISHWLAAGHQVTILNVFTRSLYAPYSDAETMPASERLDYVSALRQLEDKSFLKMLGGGSMIDLDIKDAPIRLHCDSSIVCDMEVVATDPAIPRIRKALSDLVKAKGDAVLVLPLGLGHHVDHRTARDAALPLTTNLPCAFYEELPYATRDGVRVDLSRFREDANTRLHEPLFPVLCHGTHTRPTELKRRVALLYKSQIDAPLADVIANFSHRYHGAERLWANDAWVALASHEKLSARQANPEAEPLPA